MRAGGVGWAPEEDKWLEGGATHLGDVHVERRVGDHDGRCVGQAVARQVVARVAARATF